MNPDIVFDLPLPPRSAWRDITRRRFDVLVVGGGIHGAGVARDAALRGFATALIERGDWASGTSSRSSKLMHGGLRYLQYGAFGLVRESLVERDRHLRLAPGGVHRLRFRVEAPGAAASLKMRAGIAVYDLFTGGRSRGRVFAKQASYDDARMDDARFCLAVVDDARRNGAATLPYVRWLDWLRSGDAVAGARVRDRFSGEEAEVHASVCVNAAGPWAGEVGGCVSGETPGLRLTRGSHVVLDRSPGEARLFFSPEDGRVLFLMPFDGETGLLGTTDLDASGPDGEPVPTLEEVAYLRRAFDAAFPRWSGWRAVGVQCGLRPLVEGSGAPSAVSREERIVEDPVSGVVSILGGKYTTYRAVAEDVVDRIARRLRGRTGERPTRVRRLPVPPPAPDAVAALRRAFLSEDAVRLDDALLRRTSLGHRDAWTDSLGAAVEAMRRAHALPERAAQAERERFCALQTRRLAPLAAWRR